MRRQGKIYLVKAPRFDFDGENVYYENGNETKPEDGTTVISYDMGVMRIQDCIDMDYINDNLNNGLDVFIYDIDHNDIGGTIRCLASDFNLINIYFNLINIYDELDMGAIELDIYYMIENQLARSEFKIGNKLVDSKEFIIQPKQGLSGVNIVSFDNLEKNNYKCISFTYENLKYTFYNITNVKSVLTGQSRSTGKDMYSISFDTGECKVEDLTNPHDRNVILNEKHKVLKNNDGTYYILKDERPIEINIEESILNKEFDLEFIGNGTKIKARIK